MSNVREVFPILSDVNDAGVSARAIQEGDAPSTKNGMLGFSFKDSAGNVVLPQLTSAGEIKVAADSGGTQLSNYNFNVGSLTPVTVASITLVASTDYRNIVASASCFRETIIEIVHSNNAVETVLSTFLLGPGQYSFNLPMDNSLFTAGATGAQLLLLKGTNLQKISNIYGRVSVEQL